MNVAVPRGKYVIAVSGGVDSMALLDLLAKKPGLEIVVAHFNHGIRQDAAEDERLVAGRAKELRLPYAIGYGSLGKKASEEAARNARYEFLFSVQKKHVAKAVITAHHQDDLIETAFINLLRGTGYKGLAAIKANNKVLRPLLKSPKSEVLKYALVNKLVWREDASNNQDVYLRNYLRKNVVNELSYDERQKLISNIENIAKINYKLDNEIATLSQNITAYNQINRYELNMLPKELANELIAYWLRKANARDFDRKTIERLNIALRTAKANTAQPVKGKLSLKIGQRTAEFSSTV
jgi:tRNA(Ile)-lysidine synthase